MRRRSSEETRAFELPIAATLLVTFAFSDSGNGPLLGWQIVPSEGSVPLAKKARVFWAVHVDGRARDVCCDTMLGLIFILPVRHTHSGRILYQKGRRIAEGLMNELTARDRRRGVVLGQFISMPHMTEETQDILPYC